MSVILGLLKIFLVSNENGVSRFTKEILKLPRIVRCFKATIRKFQTIEADSSSQS